MTKAILKYAIAVSAFLITLSGCEREDIIADPMTDYGYLTDCIWVITDTSKDRIPESGNPFYGCDAFHFTGSGKMVCMIENHNGDYVEIYTYDYWIDKGDDIMIIKTGKAETDFLVHVLCGTHMTLLDDNTGLSYMTFLREALP